jgi:hypothetical protein
MVYYLATFFFNLPTNFLFLMNSKNIFYYL